MKTIILDTPGHFRRADTDEPEGAPEGCALVRVRRVGICGTDLHAYRGHQPFFDYPRILGHELGVEIVEVGENHQGLRVGDRCAVEPYFHCGQCVACRQGKTNCCAKLEVLGVHVDGGMRDVISVPTNKLHRSTKLGVEQLALVETLSIGAHAVYRAGVQSGENAVVIGAGPIGLATVQFLKIAGASVAVIEVNEDRRKFCADQFEVEHTLDVEGDLERRLAETLGGDLPTVVFDATGRADSMMASFRLIANGGRLVFIGIVNADVTFHDPEFHRRETTLLSSRNSVGKDFARIIRLMEEGRVDTRGWITHRADYDALIERFDSWLDPKERVVKAMLELG